MPRTLKSVEVDVAGLTFIVVNPVYSPADDSIPYSDNCDWDKVYIKSDDLKCDLTRVLSMTMDDWINNKVCEFFRNES